MTFIPDAEVLAAYTVACFILFITPGPDMSLFLAKTVSSGRRAGMAAMLGAFAGCFVHTTLAALGLSALLAASATGFLVLKVVGGFYLLWLAVDAIRHGSALNVRDGGPEGSVRRVFWLGVGVNLTNPKVVLFFVTFLPQFVSPQDPDAGRKLMFLGLYFMAINLPLCALLVLGADRVIGLLRRRPRVVRAVDYAFAGIFGAFAVKILAMPGR